MQYLTVIVFCLYETETRNYAISEKINITYYLYVHRTYQGKYPISNKIVCISYVIKIFYTDFGYVIQRDRLSI